MFIFCLVFLFISPKYLNIIHIIEGSLIVTNWIIGFNSGITKDMTEFWSSGVDTMGIDKASYIAGLTLIFNIQGTNFLIKVFFLI